MRRSRAWAAIAFPASLALISCRNRIAIEALIPVTASPMPAKSTLLFVEQPSSLDVFALDDKGLPPAGLRLESSNVQLWAYLYPWSLDELQIHPGPVENAPVASTSRAPRAPFAIYSSTLANEKASPWVLAPAASDRVGRFRLPAFDAIACANSGGCIPNTDLVEPLCEAPCESQPKPDDPIPPEDPRPPAAATATTCPSGWGAPVARHGATFCDPGPHDFSCAPGSAHFPSEPGCTAIGTACPAPGAFTAVPPLLAAGRSLIYVRASPSPGGSGTISDPFGTIGQAIAMAGSNALIVLSHDAFAETIELTNGISIFGACTEGTRLTGTIGQVAISVRGGASTIENLTLISDRTGLTTVPGSAPEIHIQDLEVDGSHSGISLTPSATLIGERVIIRSGVGCGLCVEGSDVDMSHAVLERTVGEGIDLTSASLRAHDLAIEAPATAPELQRALTSSRSSVVLDATLIEGSLEQALNLVGLTTATISFLVTRRIEPGAILHDGGFAVGMASGANVTLRHGLFQDCTNVSVAGFGAGVRGDFSDVVIEQPHNTCLAFAVVAQDGASLTFSRALMPSGFTSSARAALGSRLALADVTISPEVPSCQNGEGAVVSLSGSTVRVDRAAIHGDHAFGFAAATTSSLTISDAEIFGPPVLAGVAAIKLEDSALDVQRFRVEHPSGYGIWIVSTSTTVHIRDAHFVHYPSVVNSILELQGGGGDVRMERIAADGTGPAGFRTTTLTSGVHLTITDADFSGLGRGFAIECSLTPDCVDLRASRIRMRDIQGIGVYVLGTARAKIEDLQISGTRQHEQDDGRAIEVKVAHLTIDRFVIDDSERQGLRVDTLGSVDLDVGTFSKNNEAIELIGDQDPSALIQRVRFIDNQATIVRH